MADENLDVLLPVLLPCPLCSAQQQLSAQTAAKHLLKYERSPKNRDNRKHKRQTASLNDLSNLKKDRRFFDGLYRAEPYFVTDDDEMKACTDEDCYKSNKSMLHIPTNDNKQRSRTLSPVRQRPHHSNEDRYANFLQLCEHVECLVDKSIQRQRQIHQALSSPSKAVTRKTRKKLIKEIEKGDMNKILPHSKRKDKVTLLPQHKTDVSRCTGEMLLSDDLLVRSLRDANQLRSPTPLEGSRLQHFIQSHQNNPKNYYVWTQPDDAKYRSRFLPMRQHDLVRDDMAFRSYRRNSISNKNKTTPLFDQAVVNYSNIADKNGDVAVLLCHKDIYESQEEAIDVDDAIKRYRYHDTKVIQNPGFSKSAVDWQPSKRKAAVAVGHGGRSLSPSSVVSSLPSSYCHQQNSRHFDSLDYSVVVAEEEQQPHSMIVSSLPPIPPPRSRRDRNRSKVQNNHQHEMSPDGLQADGNKTAYGHPNSPSKATAGVQYAVLDHNHRQDRHRPEHRKTHSRHKQNFPNHQLSVRHHSQ